MRISDWSSDVCSSDLWWSLICTEGDFGEEPIDFLMTENFRQRTALDRAGKGSGWIVGPEPLFLQKEEKAPQRRCLPRSGSSRKRCPSRSEEHTSELQSLMRISYAVFCLKKKTTTT